MFIRKLILLCLTLALLAPFADAKPAKAPRHRNIHSKKIKPGPKAKWGKYKAKTHKN